MEKILSDHLARYAAEKYQKTLPLLGERAAKVSREVEKLSGDERILMEFLYGTMPLCDAADYEPELFCSYVRHALFLRRKKPWTAELPEDIFLNYVLFHRVNNEAITDCRGWFYEMLESLLEGAGEGSLEDMVKDINYWCASQASYTASDERTLSPVGVFNSGSGRCGEESTFLVTALRSAGIAARQVYTPRWAHCDDNHAWVETWVEGRWRFLGACEPEEVLDRGWFTGASSRAMLIHTRVFSDYICPDCDSEGTGENADADRHMAGETEITARDGAAFYLNDTGAYAKVERMTVAVKDGAGNPVAGARVSFELLNGAEYCSVAELYTDTEGKVCLSLGLGSIQLHISKGNCQKEVQVTNHAGALVEVILSQERCLQDRERQKREWQYIDHRAPLDFPMHPVKLSGEQKARGKRRRQEAERLRGRKLDAFKRQASEQAQILCAKKSEGPAGLTGGQLAAWPEASGRERIQEILNLSFGNSREIVKFLEAHPEKQALDFLSVLTRKDYRDITARLLEEHYIAGQQVREFSYREYLGGEEQEDQKQRDGLFLNYVWNPRVHYETITPYRSFIAGFFGEKQKEDFRREPERIWEWVQGAVSLPEKNSLVGKIPLPGKILLAEERDYSPVSASPAGVLRTRQGSFQTQKILFVAICRTLGIPARLHPVTREPEYWTSSAFCRAEYSEQGQKPVRLVLTLAGAEAPQYGVSWTIGRLVKEPDREQGAAGRFETLDFSGERFRDGKVTLSLSEGLYRLITTVRLPDGNQLEARRIVDTADFLPGEDGIPEGRLALVFRQPRTEQMLENLALEPFSLRREEGAEVEDKDIIGSGLTLLAFLEEGAEPTEHLLNELLEHSARIRESGLQVVFVVRDLAASDNETLRRTRELLQAAVYLDDFQELPETLARRMYVDPEKLPLVLLVSPDRTGRYASSGYHVGSVELLLRIAGMAGKEKR